MTDWLKKIALGLIGGLLMSYLMFHGTLARIEGKVDQLQDDQRQILTAMMHRGGEQGP